MTVLAETPDQQGAYPRLSPEQIALLAGYGEQRPVAVGDVLFRAGDPCDEFFVIVSGKVAVVDGYGRAERVLSVHGPGRFLGELNLLTGQTGFVTAVVCEPGEVLAIPVERLRAVVAQDCDLGDLILRAYLSRRTMLIGIGAGFRIIGSRFSPDTRRLREFAARNRLPHRWIDLEKDSEAETFLRELGIPPEETPVVIWRDEQVLRNPSNAELARIVGLRAPALPAGLCDLVVVGAGPAGLAAAVYGASEGLSTVLLDAVAAGGQAATSSRIENYLGFPSGISGAELAERAVIQAEKFGAQITVPAEATALEARDGYYVITLDDGTESCAPAVVIATGARYRRLDVPGMDRFDGVSVYYAATLTEAQLCYRDPVVVVGGGNSAGQAAVFLAGHAAAVRLVLREPDLGANMSRYLADQIERNPGIEVLPGHEVRELVGDTVLETVVVEDNTTDERRPLDARALFVFIGAQPRANWLAGRLALDDSGYVLTGPDAVPVTGDRPGWDVNRPPFLLESSRPGVFAVGDVRSGSIKRMASAVGEGSMAVRLVHEHLAR